MAQSVPSRCPVGARSVPGTVPGRCPVGKYHCLQISANKKKYINYFIIYFHIFCKFFNLCVFFRPGTDRALYRALTGHRPGTDRAPYRGRGREHVCPMRKMFASHRKNISIPEKRFLCPTEIFFTAHLRICVHTCMRNFFGALVL